jgi:hypothetical protein
MSAETLPILREAISQRPEWRGFSPHQLSMLMFFHGYTETPAEDLDVEAALPYALEDRDLDASEGSAA